MIVEFCQFKNGEDKLWDTYIYSNPKASYTHLSGWYHVIAKSYGHRHFYLWAHEGGKVMGVLPLVQIQSILFGRSLVSLPFLDEGGICAENKEICNHLYQKALFLYDDLKADHLDFRHRFPLELPPPYSQEKVTLSLTLSPSPDEMWKRFDAKLRNQIRKSIKSGLSVSWNGIEKINEFYDVFATNMRDLGSPVHKKEFFSLILKEFPENSKLILIHKGNYPVGAGLCFSFKDTLLMPWASSRRDYFSFCPNFLLYWEIIKRGCEKGYRQFDFGRSTPGSGTFRFKKQWGTTINPLFWQSVQRKANQTSIIKTEDSRYQWAILVWKRLPLRITNWVGPLLRKRMSN